MASVTSSGVPCLFDKFQAETNQTRKREMYVNLSRAEKNLLVSQMLSSFSSDDTAPNGITLFDDFMEHFHDIVRVTDKGEFVFILSDSVHDNVQEQIALIGDQTFGNKRTPQSWDDAAKSVAHISQSKMVDNFVNTIPLLKGAGPQYDNQGNINSVKFRALISDLVTRTKQPVNTFNQFAEFLLASSNNANITKEESIAIKSFYQRLFGKEEYVVKSNITGNSIERRITPLFLKTQQDHQNSYKSISENLLASVVSYFKSSKKKDIAVVTATGAMQSQITGVKLYSGQAQSIGVLNNFNRVQISDTESRIRLTEDRIDQLFKGMQIALIADGTTTDDGFNIFNFSFQSIVNNNQVRVTVPVTLQGGRRNRLVNVDPASFETNINTEHHVDVLFDLLENLGLENAIDKQVVRDYIFNNSRGLSRSQAIAELYSIAIGGSILTAYEIEVKNTSGKDGDQYDNTPFIQDAKGKIQLFTQMPNAVIPQQGYGYASQDNSRGSVAELIASKYNLSSSLISNNSSANVYKLFEKAFGSQKYSKQDLNIYGLFTLAWELDTLAAQVMQTKELTGIQGRKNIEGDHVNLAGPSTNNQDLGQILEDYRFEVDSSKEENPTKVFAIEGNPIFKGIVEIERVQVIEGIKTPDGSVKAHDDTTIEELAALNYEVFFSSLDRGNPDTGWDSISLVPTVMSDKTSYPAFTLRNVAGTENFFPLIEGYSSQNTKSNNLTERSFVLNTPYLFNKAAITLKEQAEAAAMAVVTNWIAQKRGIDGNLNYVVIDDMMAYAESLGDPILTEAYTGVALKLNAVFNEISNEVALTGKPSGAMLSLLQAGLAEIPVTYISMSPLTVYMDYVVQTKKERDLNGKKVQVVKLNDILLEDFLLTEDLSSPLGQEFMNRLYFNTVNDYTFMVNQGMLLSDLSEEKPGELAKASKRFLENIKYETNSFITIEKFKEEYADKNDQFNKFDPTLDYSGLVAGIDPIFVAWSANFQRFGASLTQLAQGTVYQYKNKPEEGQTVESLKDKALIDFTKRANQAVAPYIRPAVDDNYDLKYILPSTSVVFHVTDEEKDFRILGSTSGTERKEIFDGAGEMHPFHELAYRASFGGNFGQSPSSSHKLIGCITGPDHTTLYKYASHTINAEKLAIGSPALREKFKVMNTAISFDTSLVVKFDDEGSMFTSLMIASEGENIATYNNVGEVIQDVYERHATNNPNMSDYHLWDKTIKDAWQIINLPTSEGQYRNKDKYVSQLVYSSSLKTGGSNKLSAEQLLQFGRQTPEYRAWIASKVLTVDNNRIGLQLKADHDITDKSQVASPSQMQSNALLEGQSPAAQQEILQAMQDLGEVQTKICEAFLRGNYRFGEGKDGRLILETTGDDLYEIKGIDPAKLFNGVSLNNYEAINEKPETEKAEQAVKLIMLAYLESNDNLDSPEYRQLKKGTVSYHTPDFLGKLHSAITSFFNKRAVALSYSGSQYVIAPTHGHVQMYTITGPAGKPIKVLRSSLRNYGYTLKDGNYVNEAGEVASAGDLKWKDHTIDGVSVFDLKFIKTLAGYEISEEGLPINSFSLASRRELVKSFGSRWKTTPPEFILAYPYAKRFGLPVGIQPYDVTPDFFRNRILMNMKRFITKPGTREDYKTLEDFINADSNAIYGTGESTNYSLEGYLTEVRLLEENIMEMLSLDSPLADLLNDLSEEEGENALDLLSKAIETLTANTFNSFDASLNILVGRIPSSGQQSTTVGRVVGFLHGSKNTIYSPVEMMIVQGADMDIDKAVVVFREVGPKGEYIASDPEERAKRNDLSEQVNESRTRNTIFHNLFYVHGAPENQVQGDTPVGLTKLNKQKDLRQADKPTHKLGNQQKLSAVIVNKNEQQVGKAMVGVFANGLKAYALMFHADRMLKQISGGFKGLSTKKIKFISVDKVDPVTNQVIPGRLTEYSQIAELNKDGDQIWQDFSEYINAATDNAKELILGAIGANASTGNILTVGAIYGIDASDLFDLFSAPYISPILDQIVNISNIQKNRYAAIDIRAIVDELVPAEGSELPYDAAQVEQFIQLFDAGTEIFQITRLLSINRELPFTPYDQHKYLRTYTDYIQTLKEIIETLNGFSLEKWVNEDGYSDQDRDKMLAESIKISRAFSIPEILDNLPNIKQAIRTLFAATAVTETQATHFKMAEQLVSEFKERSFIKGKQLSEDEYKGVIDHLLELSIHKFITKEGHRFLTPFIYMNKAVNSGLAKAKTVINFSFAGPVDTAVFVQAFPAYFAQIKNNPKNDFSQNKLISKMSIINRSNGSFLGIPELLDMTPEQRQDIERAFSFHKGSKTTKIFIDDETSINYNTFTYQLFLYSLINGKGKSSGEGLYRVAPEDFRSTFSGFVASNENSLEEVSRDSIALILRRFLPSMLDLNKEGIGVERGDYGKTLTVETEILSDFITESKHSEKQVVFKRDEVSRKKYTRIENIFPNSTVRAGYAPSTLFTSDGEYRVSIVNKGEVLALASGGSISLNMTVPKVISNLGVLVRISGGRYTLEGRQSIQSIFSVSTNAKLINKLVSKINALYETDIQALSASEIAEQYGEQYAALAGFVTPSGQAVINLDRAGIDTPFHEMGHLLYSLLAKSNPELIQEITALALNTNDELSNWVRANYPNVSEAVLAEEIFVHYLSQDAVSSLSSIKGENIKEKKSVIRRIWSSITEFFSNVFGEGKSLKSVRGRTLRDIIKEVGSPLLSNEIKDIFSEDELNSIQGIKPVYTDNSVLTPSELRASKSSAYTTKISSFGQLGNALTTTRRLKDANPTTLAIADTLVKIAGYNLPYIKENREKDPDKKEELSKPPLNIRRDLRGTNFKGVPIDTFIINKAERLLNVLVTDYNLQTDTIFKLSDLSSATKSKDFAPLISLLAKYKKGSSLDKLGNIIVYARKGANGSYSIKLYDITTDELRSKIETTKGRKLISGNFLDDTIASSVSHNITMSSNRADIGLLHLGMLALDLRSSLGSKLKVSGLYTLDPNNTEQGVEVFGRSYEEVLYNIEGLSKIPAFTSLVPLKFKEIIDAEIKNGRTNSASMYEFYVEYLSKAANEADPLLQFYQTFGNGKPNSVDTTRILEQKKVARFLGQVKTASRDRNKLINSILRPRRDALRKELAKMGVNTLTDQLNVKFSMREDSEELKKETNKDIIKFKKSQELRIVTELLAELEDFNNYNTKWSNGNIYERYATLPGSSSNPAMQELTKVITRSLQNFREEYYEWYYKAEAIHENFFDKVGNIVKPNSFENLKKFEVFKDDNGKEHEIFTGLLKDEKSADLTQDERDYLKFFNDTMQDLASKFGAKIPRGYVPLIKAEELNVLLANLKEGNIGGAVGSFFERLQQRANNAEAGYFDIVDTEKDDQLRRNPFADFNPSYSDNSSKLPEKVRLLGGYARLKKLGLVYDENTRRIIVREEGRDKQNSGNLEHVIVNTALSSSYSSNMGIVEDAYYAIQLSALRRSDEMNQKVDKGMQAIEEVIDTSIRQLGTDSSDEPPLITNTITTLATVASAAVMSINPLSSVRERVGGVITLFSNSIRSSIIGDKGSYSAANFSKALMIHTNDNLFNNDENKKKSLMLANLFGYYNQDLNHMRSPKNLKSTSTAGLAGVFSSDFLYSLQNASDYANRVTHMIAQMLEDGTWDAYSINEVQGKDGSTYYELIYDEKKDARLNNGTPEAKALRKYLIEEQTKSTGKASKVLTKAYSAEMLLSSKAQMERVLGVFGRENAPPSMTNSVIGKAFWSFKKYMLGKINEYTASASKETIMGEMSYYVDPKTNEMVSFFQGDQQEGIFLSLNVMIAQLKANNFDMIRSYKNLNDTQQRNLRAFGYDLAVLCMILILQHLALDDEEESKNPWARFAKTALFELVPFAGFFLGGGIGSIFFALTYVIKVYDALVNTASGQGHIIDLVKVVPLVNIPVKIYEQAYDYSGAFEGDFSTPFKSVLDQAVNYRN